MAENSKIEWTDHTFNPWTGCTKISDGCDGCYAEAWSKRAGAKVGKWGPGMPRVRTTPANWRQPLKWNAQAAAEGRRFRVFCASLADVFDNEVDPAWRADLFALIRATPNLDWLLLTKRIGNVPAMVSIIPGWLPDNVWLGATVVNQTEADRDIPKLLSVPAAKRFLSMEPLLGPVDLRNVAVPREHDQLRRPWDVEGYKFNALSEHDDDRFHQAPATIDWVIVGGESGPGARPMHPDWARGLRDQCAAAGVPFLFKQWGEWEIASEANGHFDSDMARNAAIWMDVDGKTAKPSSTGMRNAYGMVKVGKKAAGRMLDGRTHDGFPGSEVPHD